MIKANELRIGSLVFTNRNNYFKTITEIRHFKCSIRYIRTDTNLMHESMVDYEDLIPIELTEEMLIKFGFEKSSSTDSKEWDNFDSAPENSICIEFVDNEFYFTGGEGIPFSRKCRFVHELQNLYFALTGSELVLLK